MDHQLKIGLVSAFDFAVPSGVNNHIQELADQFEGEGHPVKIIAPCSDPDQVAHGNFIPMGRPVSLPSNGSIARISLSVWLRPQIKAVMDKENFDIVHLHNPFSGMVPAYAATESNAVNVATFHMFGAQSILRMGGTKLAMPYFRRLHGLIAVSEPARDFVSRYFPGEYEVIPNGIQVDDYDDHVEPFAHLRDGMINLLWVGRLEKRKGLKYLLAAYAKLKWEWPNLRLLVVGPGKPDDESYRIMSERNLQDVVFVGAVSDEEKVRYYKTADLFCSPATGQESFGIVLVEAMAAGTPVVATSIPGYASVITHGKDGLLVPPKDSEALAEAIGTLLKDEGLRSSLAQNGLHRVEDFRWERVARRVMDFYETCMERVAVSAT